MNMRMTVTTVAAIAALTAAAQGREDFMRQQAYAEMQRVTGQIDVMQANMNELSRRLSRLEGGGDTQGLKAEVESLKAQVAELKRQLANQRGEIVRDLSGRLAKIQQATAPAPAPAPAPRPEKPAYTGKCQEYVVQPGDTLSMIAAAFDTTVDTVKSMNNLKSNNIMVGRKLLVPKPKK